MSASLPTREPTSAVAGDTIAFTKSLSHYPPSDGWTLAYSLLISDDTLTATVTSDGSTYTVTFAASATEDIVSTITARLVGRVSKDGVVRTIYDGPLSIAANPSEATLDESRSATEIELAAVQTALLEVAQSGGLTAYTINGRSFQVDAKWLAQREAMLTARLRSERGLGFRHHRVAFGAC